MSQATWTNKSLAKFNVQSDKSWASAEFIARPLSEPWAGKLHPLLSINDTRLIVAAGTSLRSYEFKDRDVKFEDDFDLRGNGDITGLTSIDDDTYLVGFANGAVERVTLSDFTRTKPDAYQSHTGDCIESLNYNGSNMLSLSSSGFVTLHSAQPTYVDLGNRSWSSHLSSNYAAFGTSSATPLTIHSLASFSATPSAILASSPDADHVSAVYAITTAPPASPWGSSDQIIVSGWYDGVVRVHDLRSSSRAFNQGLMPALTLSDPWSYEPIYSLSCGGGSGSHIAAGSARHSVVSFWDVRTSTAPTNDKPTNHRASTSNFTSPTAGWSVHAPGNDRSPVYAVKVDGSRVFGVTQSRPFVLDFGSDVTEATYPTLPAAHYHASQKQSGWATKAERNTGNGLSINEDGLGYYVTKYSHHRGGAQF